MIAKALGTPLIPWQRYVADVAGERLADGSYAYEIVIISVPRQTGKTVLVRAIGVMRALVGRDVFYTAQTGKDARARWYDLVKILRVTKAFKNRIKIALRGGSEHVLFPGGGVFQCFAPTPESLHGYTPPTVIVDEAFAQTGGRGEMLMGAIGPAQFTIVDRQIIIVSTRGTAESEWFHGLISQALGLWEAHLGNGDPDAPTPTIALFDWGAREDQSPYDPAHIADFHPGVGFTLNGKLLKPEHVLSELSKNTRAEYERAFGNRETLTSSHLISPDDWNNRRHDGTPTLDLARCVLAYDVAHDRQSAAIIAVSDEAGIPCGVVLRSGPGTAWLVDALDHYATTSQPLALAAVDNGPVLDITRQLRKLGHEPTVLGEREWSAATTGLLTRLDDATVTWWASDDDAGATAAGLLRSSITGLVTRTAAVDGVAFSRRHSVGDSSPGFAFTAGVAVLDAQAGDVGDLMFTGKSA